MVTPRKIEEWIKEIQERPESGPIILRYLANRLRELSEVNEKLLTENIALQSGKRIAEYEEKITHLEYQMKLLSNQIDGDHVLPVHASAGENLYGTSSHSDLNAFIYDVNGNIERFELSSRSLNDGMTLCHYKKNISADAEAPRLLLVPNKEELIYVFSSGRILTTAVKDIHEVKIEGGQFQDLPGYDLTFLRREIRGGEKLAFVTPISKLPFSKHFVQVSRRGYAKKMRTSMAQSIFSNRYIGKGATEPKDQPFNICFSEKNEDEIVLVSYEGFVARLPVNKISNSIEEVFHLAPSDYLISCFIMQAGSSFLGMTQTGKAIHMTTDLILSSGTKKTKGQPVFSKQRRNTGARFVGAGLVHDGMWAVGLHQDGQLKIFSVNEIFSSGRIPAPPDLVAFELFSITDIPNRKTSNNGS